MKNPPANKRVTRRAGRFSRLTTEEIGMVRTTHDRLVAAKNDREFLCTGLGISTDTFTRIGRGDLGRRPKDSPKGKPR